MHTKTKKIIQDYIVNKEARRLYAELKFLTHLISDEIMML